MDCDKILSMKTILTITLIGLLSLVADTIQKAEYYYLTHGCQSCHGMYGEGVSAPRLQGVKKELLYTRLRDLQAGKTRTPNGNLMITFAKSMDANMTEAMVNYLSTLKTPEDREYYEVDPNDDGTS